MLFKFFLPLKRPENGTQKVTFYLNGAHQSIFLLQNTHSQGKKTALDQENDQEKKIKLGEISILLSTTCTTVCNQFYFLDQEHGSCVTFLAVIVFS